MFKIELQFMLLLEIFLKEGLKAMSLPIDQLLLLQSLIYAVIAMEDLLFFPEVKCRIKHSTQCPTPTTHKWQCDVIL